MAVHSYGHEALPPGDFFRIAELQPGTEDSVIQILLHSIRLHNPWPFRALSYVWGAKEDVGTLCCHNELMSVPRNLLHALRALRSPSSSVYLWADSLCINQRNPNEKGAQVALMGKIYEQATEVVVWLGTDQALNAARAFDLCRQIAHHDYPLFPRRAPITKPRHEYRDEDEWPALVEYARPEQIKKLSSIDIEQWKAIADIFARPWFWRVWVIQEVGLASSTLVICGNATISWQELFDAANCIDNRANSFAKHFNMVDGVQQCVDLYWVYSRGGRERSLIETLDDGRSFFATNARDKVFALLSHPSARNNNGGPIIAPDYTSTMRKINVDLAIELLKSKGTLQVLSAVQHRSTHSIESSPLPSWVPRWEDPPWAYMLWARIRHRTYCTGAETEAKYHLGQDDLSLVISGTLFGAVDSCSGIIAKEQYQSQDVDALDPMETITGLLESRHREARKLYDTEEQWLKAQYMTATAGLFMGTESDFLLYRASRTTTKSPSEQLHASKEGNQDLFVVTASLWSNKRKFFITAEGYIGLGPSAMQEKDVICVFFGCMVPFCLRRHQGYYRLVGECYLHGIMKGEAIELWSKGEIAEQEFVLK